MARASTDLQPAGRLELHPELLLALGQPAALDAAAQLLLDERGQAARVQRLHRGPQQGGVPQAAQLHQQVPVVRGGGHQRLVLVLLLLLLLHRGSYVHVEFHLHRHELCVQTSEGWNEDEDEFTVGAGFEQRCGQSLLSSLS